ncbi:hypothetical protein [Streptomyces sp. 4N124]|uniref:hypothetical protein n=1 Tax=Streptomyces sp. 4N124 TaxID=3457420 RepID=UPI003FD67565
MSEPPASATVRTYSAPVGDGRLGSAGYEHHHHWTAPATARARAAALVATHRGSLREVVRNPHAEEEWAQALVRAPRLLMAVRGLLGPDITVDHYLRLAV